MYLEKRWLVPAALSFLLLGALLAVVMLVVGSRFPEASGAVRATEIASDQKPNKAAEPAPPPAPTPAPPPAELAPPAPDVSPVTQRDAVVADAAPEVAPSDEPVGTETENRQKNSRGFGDIGMQFQDVTVNAPITNIHISNQGNNNATNVNLGKGNTIVSKQSRLQSNRSDGGVLAEKEPPKTTSTKASQPSKDDGAPSAPSDSPKPDKAVPAND